MTKLWALVTLNVPLGMPLPSIGHVSVINCWISCALVVWTPRPCWGDPYRPHKEGLLPYFQHCTEPHCINGGLKINDLFLWNKCLFYLWIYKPDCHIWESSKHQVHSWLNKQLLLGPRGTECNLSICQDRYRRECCAQGESCCRDRKSPGQVAMKDQEQPWSQALLRSQWSRQS